MHPQPWKFDHPQSVEITQKRWEIRIKIVNSGGKVTELVASADSLYTEGSGIWFGTAHEQAEAYQDMVGES